MPEISALLGQPALERFDGIEAMKSQLIIALVNRLGGSLEMPVEEVDGTGAFDLMMGADDGARTFTFRVVRKER